MRRFLYWMLILPPVLLAGATATALPADVKILTLGCLVGSVKPGGPADQAGLKAGDVIIQAGGSPVESVEALQRIIAQSGESLTLQAERSKESVRMTARFTPESGRKLGITCGPLNENPSPSATIQAEAPSVEFPTACPYSIETGRKVTLTLKDGRILAGKLLSCDSDKVAIRTGIMYRAFRQAKVANLESR